MNIFLIALVLVLSPLRSVQADTVPIIDIFKLKGESCYGSPNIVNGVISCLPGSSTGHVLTWNGSQWYSAPAATATWGSITGTLSSQSDLATALSLKANISSLAAVALSGLYSDLTGQPTNLSQFSNDTNFITSPQAPVQSVASKVGVVTLNSSDVGLSNVNNTSDANKPISAATQTALNLKYDSSNPSSYIASSGAPVQSVFGRTGAIAAQSGDYFTSQVTELTNLYFTQGRFDSAFSAKSTSNLNEGSNLYYTQSRFDSAFTAKSTTNLSEGLNLYWTQARFDTALSAKSTSNLSEGSNLYFTNARVDTEFDTRLATKSTSNLTEGSNLYFTTARARASLSATSPVLYNNSTGVISEQQSNASQAGFLSAADWTSFNNKLDRSESNYITNPDAEVNTVGWNLYNDAGRTTPAFVVDQDITYTSALSGDSGNGATITYSLGTSPYAEPPIVTCPTGTSVLVKWYNGPTLADNPTATVLKAAYDATPCAVAIATSAITGTASRRQYETGTVTLGGGGDTSPVDGTGGTVNPAVTFTRNTTTPLEGTASFDLFKDTNSREGTGVSTDFTIPALDKGNKIQVSFAYSGSSGMVLGSSSDVRIFVYDVTNAILLPLTPLSVLKGPVSSALIYEGQFTASANSVLYRLILHMATTSTTAYDLLLDQVTVNDELIAGEPTQVPSVVLPGQTINSSVTDHMVVMWTDGASAWVPATQAGGANPVFGTDRTMLGFATNIIGLTADIFVHGFMDGFSFGPFLGFEQYIDGTAGGISPLPAPFTDTYVAVGKSVTATALNIDFHPHRDQIGIKGSLLTNSGVNDSTGDTVLAVGTNGSFLMANSGSTNGIAWIAPVATAPIVYTAATHTFSCTTATSSVTGCLSAADHTTFAAAAPLASPAFTGTPSLPTGTTGVTQAAGNSTTALATTAFVTTADNLKAPLASPAFTGAPSLPTGTTAVTQAAGNSTTALATTAFATTANNLKANAASPTFTGTVTLPAINLIDGATNGTNTVLVYKDGHIKSTQTTAATATVGTPAGTGATCTLTGGTDSSGSINLTTTATLPTSGIVCTVNFNKAYGVAPHCVTTAISSGAIVNEVTSGVFFSTTTAGLKINFANSDVTGHTYNYDYYCVETQ